MKIVIATPFYPPEKGVLGMYAQGLQGAFERAGHEVVMCSYGPLKRLPPLVRHIALFFRIYTQIWKSDFVLALDTWSVGLPAAAAAAATRTPLIVRIGGDFLWEAYAGRTKESVRLSEFYAKPRAFSRKEKIIRSGISLIVRRAERLLFNSRFQKDIWQKAYAIPAEKSGILENFFPPKTEEIPAQESRVFVAAGREIALKNRSGLDRAFARMHEKYPKAELDTRVLPPAEHLARLRSCYAVVIPSISDIAPNTAIDAVTAGKPFITTEDTGAKERLGECGLFVDTRSEDALVQAIETMLTPDRYEYFRARISEFTFTHSWDDMAKEIIASASV